ncbi:hypothetical protein Tco_0770663 [Tanacetum coccineum]|uniref:Uncharacterized protein n=1 Tax=Tanacetum coccineum TaxID=301880 RepID=A0ABQ4ZFR5_9ASTR
MITTNNHNNNKTRGRTVVEPILQDLENRIDNSAKTHKALGQVKNPLAMNVEPRDTSRGIAVHGQTPTPMSLRPSQIDITPTALDPIMVVVELSEGE